MSDRARPAIAVVGSVNLDLVASADRLPAPGETVTGAILTRHPGGKGGNQALAARRLGAEVVLFAATGNDPEAEQALALLVREGVDISACERHPEAATGLALIAVAGDGENQIIVAPGANARFSPHALDLDRFDAVICQLEIPTETIARAAAACRGLFVLNLAPARPVPAAVLERAGLVVVNEGEARALAGLLAGYRGLLAVTFGARGAELRRDGEVVARARPPAVEAVDSTGAGDAFTAALTLGLAEGRPQPEALAFACAAGAL
ncbi:MAG: ribokinase, partial [Rhodothalassiaceae bacterium]